MHDQDRNLETNAHVIIKVVENASGNDIRTQRLCGLSRAEDGLDKRFGVKGMRVRIGRDYADNSGKKPGDSMPRATNAA